MPLFPLMEVMTLVLAPSHNSTHRSRNDPPSLHEPLPYLCAHTIIFHSPGTSRKPIPSSICSASRGILRYQPGMQ
ncbi:alcohol dehydrogenase [Histoplasma ohiense]|nr:alcohol dehydrogenase [Histoplasma ohiense (nom. inval.)]